MGQLYLALQFNSIFKMKKSIFLASLFVSVLACTKESVTPTSNTTFINIKKGNDYTFVLPINSSPGSTGVIWYVSTKPNEKIAVIDEGEMVENVKPASIWGTSIWKIKAIANGKTSLILKFGRTSVPSESFNEKSFEITVTE
ncbi:COG5513 Predicted secreted protein [Spirosomataceae bacterium]|jgi:predicted secreted protein